MDWTPGGFFARDAAIVTSARQMLEGCLKRNGGRIAGMGRVAVHRAGERDPGRSGRAKGGRDMGASKTPATDKVWRMVEDVYLDSATEQWKADYVEMTTR